MGTLFCGLGLQSPRSSEGFSIFLTFLMLTANCSFIIYVCFEFCNHSKGTIDSALVSLGSRLKIKSIKNVGQRRLKARQDSDRRIVPKRAEDTADAIDAHVRSLSSNDGGKEGGKRDFVFTVANPLSENRGAGKGPVVEPTLKLVNSMQNLGKSTHLGNPSGEEKKPDGDEELRAESTGGIEMPELGRQKSHSESFLCPNTGHAYEIDPATGESKWLN